MPIADHQLVRAGFVVFEEQITFRQALASSDFPKSNYVIIRFATGKHAVVQRIDLVELKNRFEREGRAGAVMDQPLGGLAASLAVDPVSPDVSPGEAQSLAVRFPGQPLVVVGEGGQILGLWFTGSVRAALNINPDPKVVSAMASAVALSQVVATLTEKGAPSQFEPERPTINVEVRDQQNQRFDAKKQPLQRSQLYSLVLDVDLTARLTSLAAAPLSGKAFEAGEEEVELTIRLASDDFKFRPEQQPLTVTRQGKSFGSAVFTIQPLHDGLGVINAVFLKNNNFIQVMSLTFYTGERRKQLASFKVETAGRPVEAAFAVPRRDVSLTILKMGDGFQAILSGPVAATATLPLTVPQLDMMIARLRDALLGVVNLESGGKKLYQAGIDIPEAVSRSASLALAIEGYRLYRAIFFGEAADEQTRRLGTRLREMAALDRLDIQIFSKEFMLPWGLLYLAEQRPRAESEVNPECFLGLRHVIEHIPLQPDMQVLDSQIDAAHGLKVGVNVNEAIDVEMKRPIIAEQVRYWREVEQGGRAAVVVRRQSGEVLEALANTQATPDQLMYFYCHAVARSLAEGQGPDSSTLRFSDRSLSLGELRLDAGPEHKLPGNPLVFINACQSAELSPMFYGGFVPYFMSKGARGVIGTECDTPALFAKEWAGRFFDRFLKGEPLGEIVLGLRREFYFQHNNILGLLYALYVDGDTRVAR